MSQWRRFVQGDLGYPPREIDNLALKGKIERRRAAQGYPASDEDLGLQDKKDFYTLSVNFFRFFYDTYGCNQIIVQKYETEPEGSERTMPMSAGRQRDGLKAGMQPITPGLLIQGPELTVVYESLRNLELQEDEAVLRRLRATARELLATPGRSRAE